MLTEADLATVPIFASLDSAARLALARAAADIVLGAGDTLMHEGDPPALFAVLSGAMHVTKLIDGIERRIGERGPGQIMGEVPLVYGTQFQSSAVAAVPSRVMRLEARQYYTLAGTAPAVVKAMGDLARERIGGLQGIAAQARPPQVTILGERWDPRCLGLRQFLAANQIAFEWVTPDSPGVSASWPGAMPAADELPAFRFGDGTVVCRPSPRALAGLLGLQTAPRLAEYDTVIIGGGPAGLAAAVYGASEGLTTLVIERSAPGGQAGTSSRIENYLGFPSGISGDELASRALRQARRLGAEVLITRQIEGIDLTGKTIALDGGDTIRARTIILATGVSWRRLTLDGFDRLIGKGIYYGAARSEAGATQGLDIHLIGGGNSAGQAAMFFANHAKSVTLVIRGPSLAKSMSQYLIDQIAGKANIVVAAESEIVGVRGEEHLSAVEMLDRRSGARRVVDCGGLFVFIGADAETDWLPAGLARDGRGYVLTGDAVVKAGQWAGGRDPYLLETSVPGVFACGDVRLSPVKRVAAAVGEGSMAIAFVHQYLAGQPG